MGQESSPEPPQQDSDYDGAWKEALRLYLAAFIEKFFSAEYAAIDWSYEPEWFDQVPDLQARAPTGERVAG